MEDTQKHVPFFSNAAAALRSVSAMDSAIVLIPLCAFVALLLLPAQFQFMELRTLAVALLSAVLAQALIDWVTKGSIPLSKPAIVSGLLIGSIISFDTDIALIFIVAALAMLLKRLIRFRNIPIFNPAGLGLLIGTIFLGTHNAWWTGTPFLPLELLLGFSILFISHKLHKLRLQASFVITWIALWGAVLISANQPLSLSFFLDISPLFLMAFMLIEHTTSPANPRWQPVYGVFVALLGFAFIQSSLPIEAMLVALLAGNGLNKILLATSQKK